MNLIPLNFQIIYILAYKYIFFNVKRLNNYHNYKTESTHIVVTNLQY